jgi:hypothetical protein
MIALTSLAVLVLFAPGDPHGAKPGSVTLPPLSAERPASGPTTLNVGCIVLPAGSQVKDGSVPDMGFGEILLPSGQSLRWTNGKITPQPKKGEKGASRASTSGQPLAFRRPGAGLVLRCRFAAPLLGEREREAGHSDSGAHRGDAHGTAAACAKAK